MFPSHHQTPNNFSFLQVDHYPHKQFSLTMAVPKIEETPYPVSTRTSTTLIASTPITAALHPFTDKLLLLLHPTSTGKLTHWLHVPLASPTPQDPTTAGSSITNPDEGNELLPLSHLTATTVLGGTKSEEEVLGQTLAVMVGSAILTKRPAEERLLVIGLGLPQGFAGGQREGFEGLVGVCLDCI